MFILHSHLKLGNILKFYIAKLFMVSTKVDWLKTKMILKLKPYY